MLLFPLFFCCSYILLFPPFVCLLLTQYVRGLRQDDLHVWEKNCYLALRAGLELRGAGRVGVVPCVFPAGFSHGALLRRRCPGDDAVHNAFPSALYGESENGHLVHCERAAEFDLDALLRIDTAQTLLVRMQVFETLSELKRRLSVRRKQRIFKHIVVLDLANIPVVKLTFSASARAVMATTLGLQNHWCVALRARVARVGCAGRMLDLSLRAPTRGSGSPPPLSLSLVLRPGLRRPTKSTW